MRRIRLALVALAAVILVPVVLLVDGARESLELERAVRHEAVAERTFDEMERTLSEFLGTEEARPIGDYRAADGRPAPLENRAAPPFVLGYFELESGGALRVLRARAPAAVDAQVQSAFRRERAAALEKGRRDAAERQAPGTTLKLGQAAKAARNFVTTGRQGLYRYNNMDHSIAMGRRVAKTLIQGHDAKADEVAAGQEYFG